MRRALVIAVVAANVTCAAAAVFAVATRPPRVASVNMDRLDDWRRASSEIAKLQQETEPGLIAEDAEIKKAQAAKDPTAPAKATDWEARKTKYLEQRGALLKARDTKLTDALKAAAASAGVDVIVPAAWAPDHDVTDAVLASYLPRLQTQPTGGSSSRWMYASGVLAVLLALAGGFLVGRRRAAPVPQ